MSESKLDSLLDFCDLFVHTQKMSVPGRAELAQLRAERDAACAELNAAHIYLDESPVNLPDDDEPRELADRIASVVNELIDSRADVARLTAQLTVLDDYGEDGDGLAALNRLYAASERGDIDQHCAPDIQAARAELVARRKRVAELERERDETGEAYSAKCYTVSELQRINSELISERDSHPATLTPRNCEACQIGWRMAIEAAADKLLEIAQHSKQEWIRTSNGKDISSQYLKDYNCEYAMYEVVRALPMPSFGADDCAGCEPLKPELKSATAID